MASADVPEEGLPKAPEAGGLPANKSADSDHSNNNTLCSHWFGFRGGREPTLFYYGGQPAARE